MEVVESNPQARRLAMACHLLSFAYCIIRMGLILGPAILWMTQRRRFPFVDDQGKESVNFQITVLGAALLIGLLSHPFPRPAAALLLLLGGIHLVLTLIAAFTANRGIAYRYPICWRLLK